MKPIPFVWFVPMLLVATISIAPSQLAAQATSVTPQEPTTLGEIFRVDPSTGAPTALERVKIKNLKVGQTRQPGIFQPLENVVDFYIEGVTSTVAFQAGDPQQFVIRLMSPEDKYGRELNAAEVLKHIGLMRLVVQDIKKHDDRFLTKTMIPLDVQPYGQPTTGLDAKKPDRTAQSFRLIPHVALTPGEYLILLRGTHNFELIANGLAGNEDWAFKIVQH